MNAPVNAPAPRRRLAATQGDPATNAWTIPLEQIDVSDPAALPG